MPVLQGDQPAGDIIGGLLGAAGAFIGGQQRAKQQKADQTRQAALDAQTVAETLYRHAEDQKADAREDVRAGQQATTFQEGQTTFQQGQEDRTHDQAVATALAQFRHKLSYPTTWNKMRPEQKIAYLQQRMNKAQQMGDKDTATATKDEIDQIQKPLIAAANQAAAMGRTVLATGTQARDTDVREQGEDWRTVFRVENRPSKSTPDSGNLTPAGQSFMDMLTNTNNPASPREAMNALGHSSLPAHDKTIIQSMLESPKMSKLYTVPNTQAGDYTPRTRAQTGTAAAAAGLEGNPQFGALPAPVQAYILKRVKSGVSKAAIINEANDPSAGLTDEQKAAVRSALGGR